jgi:DNA (cytosine-5)-methyltransferase 1
MMAAYYNENDPKTAAWLRELIKAGLIADGEVDDRSIESVSPGDVQGFVQCHFFAGIGGWSFALRLAGWPDDRAVWTGSCPCQPFSAAGKGDGAADSRHLWPAWFRLIAECRPVAVFGEQVASPDGLGWLDRVSTDLEATDYAVGAADLCAAGVGAFHIRQRLWFVADAQYTIGRPFSRSVEDERHGYDCGRQEAHGEPGACGAICIVGDTSSAGGWRQSRAVPSQERTSQIEGRELGRLSHQSFVAGDVGVSASGRREWQRHQPEHVQPLQGSAWANCDWIDCTDGKTRPIEPGTFPLAHGVPARVGRLRGYGNAIVPHVAAEFIAAYLEATEDRQGAT